MNLKRISWISSWFSYYDGFGNLFGQLFFLNNFAAWCSTSILSKMVAPSLVTVSSPSGEIRILSIPNTKWRQRFCTIDEWKMYFCIRFRPILSRSKKKNQTTQTVKFCSSNFSSTLRSEGGAERSADTRSGQDVCLVGFNTLKAALFVAIFHDDERSPVFILDHHRLSSLELRRINHHSI